MSTAHETVQSQPVKVGGDLVQDDLDIPMVLPGHGLPSRLRCNYRPESVPEAGISSGLAGCRLDGIPQTVVWGAAKTATAVEFLILVPQVCLYRPNIRACGLRATRKQPIRYLCPRMCPWAAWDIEL